MLDSEQMKRALDENSSQLILGIHTAMNNSFKQIFSFVRKDSLKWPGVRGPQHPDKAAIEYREFLRKRPIVRTDRRSSATSIQISSQRDDLYSQTLE